VVLFGFYPIRKHTVTTGNGSQAMYDLMGKDTVLFRYDGHGPASDAAYVQQARTWFNSMWTTISREHKV
jgi:hypothetical protein